MTYIPDCREDEAYNEKYLNHDDKEYIKGYDYAVDDILDSFFDNITDFDFDIEDEDIDLGKIFANHEPILNRLKEVMKEFFESERDEMITSMIDHMDDEEYDKIKEKVDNSED